MYLAKLGLNSLRQCWANPPGTALGFFPIRWGCDSSAACEESTVPNWSRIYGTNTWNLFLETFAWSLHVACLLGLHIHIQNWPEFLRSCTQMQWIHPVNRTVWGQLILHMQNTCQNYCSFDSVKTFQIYSILKDMIWGSTAWLCSSWL